MEIQLRLRDYLAEKFNALKLTPNDVFKNARSMAKLFKEAGRLKNILSANSDHFAQVIKLFNKCYLNFIIKINIYFRLKD